jgi:hypothetical protein
VRPTAVRWRFIAGAIELADPDYVSYTHLYISQIPWERGRIGGLLRAVADDAPLGF